MKIIIGKNGSGKTTTAIKLAAKENLCIVCLDKKRSENILIYAKDMGLNILSPITFYEFITKEYYDKRVKGFILDGMNEFLSFISPRSIPIKMITINEGYNDEINKLEFCEKFTKL